MSEASNWGELAWTKDHLAFVRSLMGRIAREEERARSIADKEKLRDEVREGFESQILIALHKAEERRRVPTVETVGNDPQVQAHEVDVVDSDSEIAAQVAKVRLAKTRTDKIQIETSESEIPPPTLAACETLQYFDNLSSSSHGQAKSSIAEILGRLLEIGKPLKVSHIRYYHFHETALDGQLVVVDSAGHDRSVAQHLRSGPIVKFKSACPLPSVDSYWCQHEKMPVLFSVEPNASAELKPILYPGALPLIRTPLDNCEKYLAKHKSAHWIDIPLFLFGKFIGKLTCDIEATVAETVLRSGAISQLWAAASQAATYLETLYREQFDYPLAAVISEVQRLESTEKVFEYCVKNLLTTLNCRQGVLFERLSDDFQAGKIVLRRSSNGSTKSLHEAVYDSRDEAPTAWVARNNIPLRLQNLNDEFQRERQLAAYRIFDSRLNWDKRDRRPAPQSYLAVPITGDLKEVTAVLRFTEKVDERGQPDFFTERDQTLLNRIANQVIGPRLEALRRTDLAAALSFEDLEKANSLLVQRAAPSSESIAKAVLAMLESFFPEVGGRKKLYLLNVLEPGGRQFSHHQIGGQLGNDLRRADGARDIYPLQGSLTGYVINKFLSSEKRDAGTVFIVDFEEAIRHGAMIPICNQGKTAIACPMVFRDRVYGVTIVKSSHYDLDLQQQGKLLRLVAAEAAAMFARRECECLQRLQGDFDELKQTPASANALRDWLRSMEKTYHCETANQSFPKQDIFNVRDTMAAAAEDALKEAQKDVPGANSTPPELDLPDIEVSTYQATLATITYSVLRDIFTRQPPSCEPVSVSANVDAGREFLDVSIGPFARDLAGAPTHQQADDVIDQRLDGRSSDLLTKQALAHLHQVAGGRRGVLRSEAPDRLSFRLPIDWPIDLVKRKA